MTKQAIDSLREWQQYRDKVERYKEQDRQQAYERERAINGHYNFGSHLRTDSGRDYICVGSGF